MPRTMEVSVPSDKSALLVKALGEVEGVVGLSLQSGASKKPPGDIVTAHMTNDSVEGVLTILCEHLDDRSSVVSNEPRSVVSISSKQQIDAENDEASWPEMATKLRRETNLTVNYALAMFFAGVIAAVGIWTSTIHLVVGAMVIAPGFEPILRVPFGVLARDKRAWQQGLSATAGGYFAMIVGGALAGLLLPLLKAAPPLRELYWAAYWSSFSWTSVTVALCAGAAGAAIIAAHRSVLTAGVMIALALIPTATLSGMALSAGDFSLAGEAAARWLLEAALVAVSGGSVFALKKGMLRNGNETARADAPFR